jgi:hypothetical protein
MGQKEMILEVLMLIRLQNAIEICEMVFDIKRTDKLTDKASPLRSQATVFGRMQT